MSQVGQVAMGLSNVVSGSVFTAAARTAQIAALLDKKPDLAAAVAPWVHQEMDVSAQVLGWAKTWFLPAVVGGALSGVASTAIAPIVTPFAMDLVEGFAGDGTLADVVGGSLAGGLTLLFVYPIEIIQTRYQLGLPFDSRPVLQYRGFSAAVAGLAVFRAAFFGLGQGIAAIVGEYNGQIATFMAAGLLCYPLETVRIRMSIDLDDEASNPVAVAAEIAANEGVLGFWSGSRYNIYKVVVEVGIALVFV